MDKNISNMAIDVINRFGGKAVKTLLHANQKLQKQAQNQNVSTDSSSTFNNL